MASRERSSMSRYVKAFDSRSKSCRMSMGSSRSSERNHGHPQHCQELNREEGEAEAHRAFRLDERQVDGSLADASREHAHRERIQHPTVTPGDRENEDDG